jgi:uncharacterized membrane protein
VAEQLAIVTRNGIVQSCSDVSTLRGRRDAFAIAAAILLAAAIALVAVAAAVIGAPIIGAIVAGVCLAVAAGLLIAAGVLAGLAGAAERQLEAAQDRLAQARADFTDAAQEVTRVCCPGCITVDLTQPSCA